MLYRDFIDGYYPHFDTSITFTYQFYRIRFCHFSWLASKNVSQNLNLWQWDCFTQSIQHDICTKEKLYLFIKKPFFYLLTFISWTSIFMPLIYRNIKINIKRLPHNAYYAVLFFLVRFWLFGFSRLNQV